MSLSRSLMLLGGLSSIVMNRIGAIFSGSADRHLYEFLTTAQVVATRTNVWTGIDMDAFATAFENAIAACSYYNVLTIPGRAYIKLNRPVRMDNGFRVRCNGAWIGTSACIIYPDLSVDWPVTYPNRGVLESSNFQFPTLPVSGAAWPANEPGFVFGDLNGLQIRCNFDSLYGSHPERRPHFGIVMHAANEGCVLDRCNVTYAQKHGILLSGFQSTPTLYNCGAFDTGNGTDTIFGAAVTRTTGGAFSGNVYVYDTPVVATTSVTLEAANGTDIDTIAGTNVLSIGGTNYTVSSVSVAAQTINQNTSISGAATTTRRIVTVTLASSIPAYTQGRNFASGIAMESHPSGSSFAPGVASDHGGQACSGMVNLINPSGDRNLDSLLSMGGSGTMAVLGAKSEYNASAVLIHGGQSGGSKPSLSLSGYRISTDAPTHTDQSVIRVVGGSTRAVVATSAGQADVANAKFIEDLSASADPGVTNVSGGMGTVFWCSDSTVTSWGRTMQGLSLEFKSNTSFLKWTGVAANLGMQFKQANAGTGTYKWVVGQAGTNDFIVLDGISAPSAGVHFKGWNGSAMTDIVAFGAPSASNPTLGFFGATPVVKQTFAAAATDAATTQTLANSLRTALINLGLGA